jgi:hypothetical protein
VSRSAASHRLPSPDLSAEPVWDQVETCRAEPRLALLLRFHVGELTATPEAVTGARAAGIDVVAVVPRHLGGDWSDVDAATRDRNDAATATGGCLYSAYCLPGIDDTLVVTTGADRSHITVTLASQHRPGH